MNTVLYYIGKTYIHLFFPIQMFFLSHRFKHLLLRISFDCVWPSWFSVIRIWHGIKKRENSFKILFSSAVSAWKRDLSLKKNHFHWHIKTLFTLQTKNKHFKSYFLNKSTWGFPLLILLFPNAFLFARTDTWQVFRFLVRVCFMETKPIWHDVQRLSDPLTIKKKSTPLPHRMKDG